MTPITMIEGTYGRLVVRELASIGPDRDSMWSCSCSCGSERVVSGRRLRNGKTRSCGCLRREVSRELSLRHGATQGRKTTPEWRSWVAMIGRCTRPRDNSYENYGGRGISVCERWRRSFVAFVSDMGIKPTPAHTIDRIDVNGNYEPANCRWATRREQAKNMRMTPKRLLATRRNSRLTWRVVVIEGVELNMLAAGKAYGLDRTTIAKRLNRGWTPRQAVGLDESPRALK